jgi:hypothetical protein
MIEYDVYKTVLQRAGDALPAPFLYIRLFLLIEVFNCRWFHNNIYLEELLKTHILYNLAYFLISGAVFGLWIQ